MLLDGWKGDSSSTGGDFLGCAVRFQVPVHSPAPRISLFLVCKDNADGAGQSREAGELALLCSVTWRGAQLAPEELAHSPSNLFWT